MNPTLAKLRHRPNPRYTPTPWPEGTKQPLTKEWPSNFSPYVSTCDPPSSNSSANTPNSLTLINSITGEGADSRFDEAWKAARQKRADFLVEKCADLAKTATPKTAHLARVQFDIYRWLASKLHPIAYGDKPQQQQQTSVNVGSLYLPRALKRNSLQTHQTRLVPLNLTTLHH